MAYTSGVNPGTDRIRVLVVDDHPPVREALVEKINKRMGMEVVADVESAREVFDVLRKGNVDVVIADISLSDSHGLNAVENIAVQYPSVHVIVYSMYDENVYGERAVRAGASGYVMKSEPTSTVIEAIHSVVRGEIYLSRRLASKILSKVAVGRTPAAGFPIDELTDREMTVFQMLGQGYSIEKIADRINLTRKTVETYRRRAKEKLGFESVVELLQYAVQWTNAQGEAASKGDREGR